MNQIKAKTLTNIAKIFSGSLSLIINIIYFGINKEVMDYEKQQSLLLLCGFIVIIFLPIDFSIIIKNILQKKMDNL